MPKGAGESLAFERHVEGVQGYVHSKEKQRQLYKRTLITVVISQIFGGAGLAAGVTVGALLAQQMLGTDSVTGVPSALFTLGSALAAYTVGRVSQKFGRRVGLTAGFLTGGIGAIGVIVAAMMNNIFLLFVALFIYGAGTATNLQARYAGTDLATSTQRATAISIAMVATTFGAVAGPNLVEVMGNVAAKMNVPVLAGPFILAAVAFLVAGTIQFLFLRPDPLLIAKAIAETTHTKEQVNKEKTTEVVNKQGVIVGASIMVLTQIVMVGIMTMTPIHMRHHGHDLKEVGMVIGFHIGAMYLPSLVTGVLVDRLGRKVMAVASGVTLLAAGLLAAYVPAQSMVGLTMALILLGLGWNFGIISGTALIVDGTTPFNRAKTQGSVDVLMALAGATGGALSGVIASQYSYSILALGGGLLALLFIPVVVWSRGK